MQFIECLDHAEWNILRRPGYSSWGTMIGWIVHIMQYNRKTMALYLVMLCSIKGSWLPETCLSSLLHPRLSPLVYPNRIQHRRPCPSFTPSFATMPAINTPASRDQSQLGHNDPKLDCISQPKAGKSPEPRQLARSSSPRSRPAEDHSPVTTASSYGMKRWLAQGSRDEPWYVGTRALGDETRGEETE